MTRASTSRGVQRRSSAVWTLLVRFFSGQYLDGQVRQTRNGVVLPKYVDYYWNRWTRGRRAMWRNGIFWPAIALTIGLLVNMEYTLLALGYVVAFMAGRLWQLFARTVHVQRPVDVHVTIPKVQIDADEATIDGEVQAELGTNLVELQKQQAPRRVRRVK